jgi:hypothetical protein
LGVGDWGLETGRIHGKKQINSFKNKLFPRYQQNIEPLRILLVVKEKVGI